MAKRSVTSHQQIIALTNLCMTYRKELESMTRDAARDFLSTKAGFAVKSSSVETLVRSLDIKLVWPKRTSKVIPVLLKAVQELDVAFGEALSAETRTAIHDLLKKRGE